MRSSILRPIRSGRELWAVEVFDEKPLSAGHWKVTWEAGHGDSEWIDEEVHFDTGRQLFVEKLTKRPYPGFGQVHCEVDKTSLTNFFGRILSVTPDATDNRAGARSDRQGTAE